MAKSIGPRIEHINFYLLKPSVTDFKKALSKDKHPSVIKAKANVLAGAALYYLAPPSKPVGWRTFLEPGFGSKLPTFDAKHASAVLFFPAAGRNFAVTFGYGRSLLDESAFVADFGLRTAIMLSNPATLRAVDYRTIEERTRIGRIQLSEAGSVNAFHVNTDTDLLRGLEAESQDKAVCDKVGARWSNLIVSSRLEFKGLPLIATKLLQYYRKKKLPNEYQWIENVRRETDPTKIQLLDKQLETLLDKSRYDKIRLAIPEISWNTSPTTPKFFKVDGADFSSSIATYLSARPKKVTSTLNALKAHRVVLVDSSTGAESMSVPVYKCVVAEMPLKDDLYLLADGEWFKLNKDFVKCVNDAVSKIPVLTHSFPAWLDKEKEDDWNTRACKAWKDAALMHQRGTIPYGGGHSSVEPADMLTKARVLGHAKRIDKNSSGLSHLFSQGRISAELIKSDANFRKEVIKRIPKSHSTLANDLSSTFDSRNWTIGYILLGADKTSPASNLPFFSKVNLKGTAERLTSIDYKVGLIGI